MNAAGHYDIRHPIIFALRPLQIHFNSLDFCIKMFRLNEIFPYCRFFLKWTTEIQNLCEKNPLDLFFFTSQRYYFLGTSERIYLNI